MFQPEHSTVVPPLAGGDIELHAFEDAPVPAIIYRPTDAQVLALNKAAREQLGYVEADVAGLTLWDLVPTSDRNELSQRLVRSPETRSVRVRSRRKDGSVFTAEGFSIPTDFAGSPARIVVYHDLSAQQQTIHQLRRLFDAFEATAEGVAILEGDRYVFVNPAHASMYGYTVAEMLGQTWQMLYDEDEVHRIKSEALPALAQHGRWSGQTQGRRKNGTQISGDISLTITPSGDLICACRDISEREIREEAVRRSQEQLAWVLEATEEGTWDWDIPTSRIAYSDRWMSMLGYQPGELPGTLTTWAERVHPEDYSRVSADVDTFLLSSKGKLQTEYRMRHRDGTWRWISDRGKVVARDPEGRALRAVGAHSDITARRQAELSLEQRSQELVEANAGLARAAQVRDEFLARISHELRTPLTTILALVEMLLGNRAEALTERQHQRILSVQESGRHLVELIDEVLDLAKLEAGTMKVNLEAVPVVGIAERAVQLIAPHAQRKELRLSFEPGPPGLAVIADPLRMKQILVNLLGNAVKFTAPGGEVSLMVARKETPDAGTWVELRIADTGIGIAPEKLDQIFQPFVQLDSGLNRTFGGSGLGLAIVKHFTELHGGTITVTSEPGRGSEFRVRLPAAAQATAQATAQAKVAADIAQSVQPAAATAGWEVLLVDDNCTNRTLVAEYLEEEGFVVHTAASGSAALDCLESRRIALALVDVQMPGMDGLELTRRIRNHPHPRIANTRIVGLTALAMSGDRDRCLAAGMDSYLAKPFALSALSALIRQLQQESQLGGH